MSEDLERSAAIPAGESDHEGFKLIGVPIYAPELLKASFDNLRDNTPTGSINLDMFLSHLNLSRLHFFESIYQASLTQPMFAQQILVPIHHSLPAFKAYRNFRERFVSFRKSGGDYSRADLARAFGITYAKLVTYLNSLDRNASDAFGIKDMRTAKRPR